MICVRCNREVNVSLNNDWIAYDGEFYCGHICKTNRDIPVLICKQDKRKLKKKKNTLLHVVEEYDSNVDYKGYDRFFIYRRTLNRPMADLCRLHSSKRIVEVVWHFEPTGAEANTITQLVKYSKGRL